MNRLFCVQKVCTVLLALFIVCGCAQERISLSTSGVFSDIVPVNEIVYPDASTTPVPLKKSAIKTTKTPIQVLVCPRPIRIPIFSLPCNTEKDCRIFGPNLACCNERCIKGVLVPKNSVVGSVRKPKEIGEANIKTRISNSIEQQKPKESVKSSPPVPVVVVNPRSNVTTTLVDNRNLICPENVRIPIFGLPCGTEKDCRLFGAGLVCCKQRCLKGVTVPKPEVKHAPALFGLVDRKCPLEPLAEIFDIKECMSDLDCNPRICCSEKLQGGSSKSYCRTPAHNIERVPGAKQFEPSLRNLVSYMQCTPAPPPLLDIFPKPCKSTFDCFPNLCCQENGKRFCRPPKRSLVSFVVGVTSRIGASDATRKFIQRFTS